MNESEFNELIDETIEAIEDKLDELDLDIDFETAGGILTITFDDDSKIIINRQAPLKQLWVAAKTGGFHFNYDTAAQAWVKDDDGTEFFSALSQYFTDHANEKVELS